MLLSALFNCGIPNRFSGDIIPLQHCNLVHPKSTLSLVFKFSKKNLIKIVLCCIRFLEVLMISVELAVTKTLLNYIPWVPVMFAGLLGEVVTL